jgi:hypothetical protein
MWRGTKNKNKTKKQKRCRDFFALLHPAQLSLRHRPLPFWLFF